MEFWGMRLGKFWSWIMNPRSIFRYLETVGGTTPFIFMDFYIHLGTFINDL